VTEQLAQSCTDFPMIEFFFLILVLLGSHTFSVRAFCFGRRICLSVCLSSVSLSRVRSRKLRTIRAKFRHPYKQLGLESKNIMSDFASEVAKYPKNSQIAQNGDLYN